MQWFLRATGLVGLHKTLVEAHRPSLLHAFEPFVGSRNGNRLRVTLVRHPCSWLASVYGIVKRRDELDDLPDPILNPFWSFATESFDRFVLAYLNTAGGSIYRTFRPYIEEADTCLRIEDMPWAALDLFESLGVPRMLRQKCVGIGKVNVSENVPLWDKSLKEEVKREEEELLELFDYW